MMRSFLALGALGLFAIAATPSSAQMCGSGQAQAEASGMCSGMMKAQAASPSEEQPQAGAKSSGCACCQNMAMMQPPKDGEGSMPGMDMPAQEAPNSEP